MNNYANGAAYGQAHVALALQANKLQDSPQFTGLSGRKKTCHSIGRKRENLQWCEVYPILFKLKFIFVIPFIFLLCPGEILKRQWQEK